MGTEIHEGEHPTSSVTARRRRGDNRSGCYLAKVLIGADGANSQVAQHFSWTPAACIPTLESEIPNLGLHRIIRHRPCADRYRRSLQGYAWIFPKQERLSVGVGEFQRKPASPKKIFDRFVGGEKGLAPWMYRKPVGHPLTALQQARAMSKDSPESAGLVSGRAMLVGDAGHLVDPLFGEGIYYAVSSGSWPRGDSGPCQRSDKVSGRLRSGRPGAVVCGISGWLRVSATSSIRSASLPPAIDPYQEIVHALLRRTSRERNVSIIHCPRAKSVVKSSFRNCCSKPFVPLNSE